MKLICISNAKQWFRHTLLTRAQSTVPSKSPDAARIVPRLIVLNTAIIVVVSTVLPTTTLIFIRLNTSSITIASSLSGFALLKPADLSSQHFPTYF